MAKIMSLLTIVKTAALIIMKIVRIIIHQPKCLLKPLDTVILNKKIRVPLMLHVNPKATILSIRLHHTSLLKKKK